VSFQTVTGWLTRIFRMDYTVFEEVGRDATATVPALAVVAVASFLSGAGSWLWWVFKDIPGSGDVFVKSFIIGSLLQIGVWFVWVYVSYTVLTRFYGATGDLNAMVRAMGLAFAPAAIAVLVFISILTIPLGLIALAGALLLSQVALQPNTNATPSQTMAANFLGFVVFAIIMGILGSVGDPGESIAPGLFFFAMD